MIHRLKQMLIKEFLQMLRDPRMRMIIFGMPVVQMVIMAFALTTDVTHIRTALLDMDKTASSRELINDFTAGGYFQIWHMAGSQKEMADLLDHAVVRAVIHIPSGFEQTLARGSTARVQVLTDGTDSNTTAIVQGYAGHIIQAYSNRKLMHQVQQQGMTLQPDLVDTQSRAWFNANQESRYYFVPSLIAVMLFIFSLLLTSIGIVKEKEIGTIEQVMVTPIRKIEFILGKTIPYMITSYISMTIMLCVAFVVFDIHVKGNILLLYGLSGLYLFGNMGIALMISASAATQQQAMLTSFLILMPCVMLSGFMFPIKNMPDLVQYATFLNPMRWYLEILRGIVMKGVGVKVLWPAIAGQAALAAAFITLAWARFSKTLS
ncbi:ABC transporter permease [Desulfobacula sp.]|uniref:ABC transporter permease n=1 Tax=Desulfobacula sp. TaxID=2593537 RepID=UPI00262964E4|nr:ABC transporter permease [Desulfobacula sp.]